MAFIKHFGIENFRIFGKYSHFDFAPITILTGTNSSGKSSLIKALLLLKDNALKPPKEDINDLGTLLDGELIWKKTDSVRLKIIPSLEKLDFTGFSHKLSSFKGCLTENSLNNSITFSIPFSLISFNDCKLSLIYVPSENENTIRGNLNELSIYHQKDEKLLFQMSQITTNSGRHYVNYDFFRNAFLSSVKPFYNEQYDDDKWVDKNKSKLEFSEPLIPIAYADEKIFTSIITLDHDRMHSIYRKILEERKITYPVDNIKDFVETFLREQIPELNKALINELQKIEFSVGVINNVSSLKKALIKMEGLLLEIRKLNFTMDYSLTKFSLNTIFSHLAEKVVYGTFFLFDDEFWAEHGIIDYLDKSFNKKEFASQFTNEKLEILYDFRILINTYKSVITSKPEYLSAALLYNSKLNLRKTKTNDLVYVIFRTIKKAIFNSLSSFKSINFIEAVRANTNRAYAYQSQGTGFNELLLQFNSKDFVKKDDEYSFIEKWIKKFGLGNTVSIQQNSDGLGNMVYIDKKPLADQGYGITQFLPILLKIAIIARENRNYTHDLDENNNTIFEGYFYYQSLLIIEEPETNLHPKLQSLLADMFVDANKQFNIQFILETHSEYLIRKLQYLTANKGHEYNIKPEDTAIYYFNDPKTLKKDEDQVKRIKIREDGILDGSFGTGFFDEASNLIIDILDLQRSN